MATQQQMFSLTFFEKFRLVRKIPFENLLLANGYLINHFEIRLDLSPHFLSLKSKYKAIVRFVLYLFYVLCV